MEKKNDIEKVDTLKEIKFQFDIIINLLARKVLDPEEVSKIITKGTIDRTRIVKCFNSCDGKTMLTDIAKNCKIDKGTLSRHVDSWEKEGFLIKIDKKGKILPKALIYLRLRKINHLQNYLGS